MYQEEKESRVRELSSPVWSGSMSLGSLISVLFTLSFPGGSLGKESTCNAGAPDSIHVSGRSSGKGNGYPLQTAYLGNPMDRGTWWATQSMGSQELGTA